LTCPHQKVREIAIHIGDERFPVADLTHLPTRCKFIAFMPQWDFLDFLATQGRRRSTFHLLLNTEVNALIERAGAVIGVRARSGGETIEVEAPLIVGADGRHSTVRSLAGLPVKPFGVPIDVLWLRLSKQPGDPQAQAYGRVDVGRMIVQLDRGDYWQCAFVIAKGSFDAIRAKGLDELRAAVAKLAPHFAGRVNEIKTWDDVRLLTVLVDRLVQ